MMHSFHLIGNPQSAIHIPTLPMSQPLTIFLLFALSLVNLRAESEWIDIFNGKDLTGWKVSEENPDSFQVVDGILVVDGPRAHLYYQEDGADAKLRNFEFEAAIKTFPSANSGVFFHTRWQERGWPRHGYEAQVNATHDDPRKTGSIYNVKDVLNDAPHEDGEWFIYNVRVEGKRIAIRVNGEIVNDYTEPEDPGHENRRLSEGTVAIQAHDPKSVIHYKNIRLRKLP